MYSSQKECEDAAAKAFAALKLNANKGQAGIDDYIGYYAGKALQVKCP